MSPANQRMTIALTVNFLASLPLRQRDQSLKNNGG